MNIVILDGTGKIISDVRIKKLNQTYFWGEFLNVSSKFLKLISNPSPQIKKESRISTELQIKTVVNFMLYANASNKNKNTV